MMKYTHTKKAKIDTDIYIKINTRLTEKSYTRAKARVNKTEERDERG